jgi:phosphatidylglycerol:prolipoprotein diacylglycerol transferase
VRSTLFFIPHQIFGVPLFGWGWVLGLLILAIIGSVILQRRSGLSWSEIVGGLTVWLLALPVIILVLPAVEQRWPDGTAMGLPVRGYGVMVLLGMLAGIGITNIRARRLGLPTDLIVGLAVWAVLGGIVGARAFYVVQKWETFHGRGWQRVIEILKLTEGGLVVYGGIIGGVIAIVIYCYRHRLNLLATGDLVVPGFLVGLSLGRIGCLLNGCCFGGVCLAPLPVIHFPQGSLPYQVQLSTGQLLGLQLSETTLPSIIQSVQPGSVAESVGVRAGDQLRGIFTQSIEPYAGSDPTAPAPVLVDIKLDNSSKRILPDQLPVESLPVHPAQIYASLNALLLCLLIWQLQPLPSRDGLVFCVGVMLYATSRFLLERIRSDEAGQLGTDLTIAQLIALCTGALAFVGLLVLLRLPPKRAWTWV